jgi:hypothetical protein
MRKRVLDLEEPEGLEVQTEVLEGRLRVSRAPPRVLVVVAEPPGLQFLEIRLLLIKIQVPELVRFLNFLFLMELLWLKLIL